MTIRNCIGWGATAMDKWYPVGNHEFLSPDKEGYKDPTRNDLQLMDYISMVVNPVKGKLQA